MPLPIPLQAIQGGPVRIGTGFLVRRGAEHWLVTCVHLVTGLKQSPLDMDLFANASIQVLGTATVLPLFEGEQQRFSVVINTTTGFLVDILAIKLIEAEIASLLHYDAYNLNAIVPPLVGQQVTAMGFPGMVQNVIPATTLAGQIDEIEGFSIRLSVPSAYGYSGSAVSLEDGLIGMIYGDIGVAPDFVNGLAIALEEVAPAIFN